MDVTIYVVIKAQFDFVLEVWFSILLILFFTFDMVVTSISIYCSVSPCKLIMKQ